MPVAELRTIVSQRQSLGDRIANILISLELATHEAAIQSAECVAEMLRAHRDARLAPNVGMDALTLVSDASRLATESRTKLGEAHELLRAISVTHNIPLGSDADCPPNEGEGRVVSPFRGA